MKKGILKSSESVSNEPKYVWDYWKHYKEMMKTSETDYSEQNPEGWWNHYLDESPKHQMHEKEVGILPTS